MLSSCNEQEVEVVNVRGGIEGYFYESRPRNKQSRGGAQELAITVAIALYTHAQSLKIFRNQQNTERYYSTNRSIYFI